MLEEVRVQVLVKAIFKLDFRCMELHLEWTVHAQLTEIW